MRAPIARVWKALTTSDEIHNWWDKGEIDPRVGGKIKLGPQGPEGSDNCDVGADGNSGPPLNGTIKVCIEPYLFEFVWHDDYPDAGLVRFDLIDIDEETTQITLVQNIPARDVIPATAGWYELVERLGAYSESGELVPLPSDTERFAKLKEVFREAGIS